MRISIKEGGGAQNVKVGAGSVTVYVYMQGGPN